MTALPQTSSPRAAHPPIRVPSPRGPVDAPAPRRPGATATSRDGSPRSATPTRPGGAGRHHRATSTANRLWLLAGRAGSLTTLAAMLVLAAAAAGLTDGTPPTGDAAAVATATLH